MNDRGAALLTVLVAMMIISIMLFEFQYSSMVERKLAYNDLNQLQAYYLAKSGIRIGLLRIALYGRAKKSPELKKMTQNIPIDAYLDSIWSLPLPAFPPDATTIAKLDGEEQDAAEKAQKQTHVTEGKSTHVITSEAAKINLNFLEIPTNQRNQRINFQAQPKGLHEYVARMLYNLVDNIFKESEDPYDEYGNIRPEEVVLDIMDWVNTGTDRLGGGSKDAFYEQQNPPYKAKQGRFFTVDELRLVRSINERLFQKLRSYVTVYSYDGKINLNNATHAVIKAIYPDLTEDDFKRLDEEKAKNGGVWASEKVFVDFIATSLNRPNIKTLYDKPEDYPFTVSSQSFLVESMGRVSKSASAIQKLVRVAVAFTGSRGGTVNTTLTSRAACEAKAGHAWYEYAGQGGKCLVKPRDAGACQSISGTWEQQNGQNCCIIPNTFGQNGKGCITPQDEQAAKDASAMKVLYWNEV